MGKAPLDHLVHGGVVILIGKALQLEALVVAFPGAPILKDHHTGHDIRAGNIRNIEGFHAAGGGNREHFSEGYQGGV